MVPLADREVLINQLRSPAFLRGSLFAVGCNP